ncbi:MAG: helix-turn-helix domain-containing protein [Lapillicoccus sp.]
MPLGVDYADQDCSLARTIEVVGERWTLLILRDCFLGVSRFRDFEARLDISKAVLTRRLTDLCDAGLLERHSGPERAGYGLTPLGRSLWPVLFTLLEWGEAHLAPDGPRRRFEHRECGRVLEAGARCPACGRAPDLEEIDTYAGPGAVHPRPDAVSARLRARRALLTPL